MKNLIFIIVIVSALLFGSCEKVVTVGLDTAKPRLVIDATLACEKGIVLSTQKIKITTTAGYYSTEVPGVSGATVFVSCDNGNEFEFTETSQSGVYECAAFEAVLDANYTLTVNYNGQIFTATEQLKSVPVIDKIEQEIKPKIGGGGNTIDIKTFFTDPANQTDYYLIRVKTSRTAIPEYSSTDDTFFQGNQVFDFYRNEDLVAGDVVDVRLGRVSQRYQNYMKILASISGNNGGGPFSTPPATVRGNIENNSNPDNYALGYFSMLEVVYQSHTCTN
ncbi:MAG: DUF4249 domain-containing protein [Flavobacterium sp.]|nr:DUF4249 domain-containing protein [Flavobacterium sp.]